ncbi:MAG: DUF2121 domain-containing protein [Methanobacteriaceae archaeon]|nr:DUF2121 domain-containing protein [Methanobacteriaceae archaeon]
MSLIIAYIGKKGCVMASDKRRIAYFGDASAREKLEEELYTGELTSDEELKNRASQLGISIKITEDAAKIKSVEETVMGEVITKGTNETRRKRIYGTTNGYQILELLGSKVTSRESGNSSIILFGNKITKNLANNLLKAYWKPSYSLKYMGDVFKKELREISQKTPSVSQESDVILVQKKLTSKDSQTYLNEVIQRDLKLLGKFRNQLKEDLMEKTRTIELARKIVNEGEIGDIVSIEGNMVQVKLNKNIQAFDGNWKHLVGPGENVIMFFNINENVKIGDKVVISDGDLRTLQNKTSLKCDIILCNL